MILATSTVLHNDKKTIKNRPNLIVLYVFSLTFHVLKSYFSRQMVILCYSNNTQGLILLVKTFIVFRFLNICYKIYTVLTEFTTYDSFAVYIGPIFININIDLNIDFYIHIINLTKVYFKASNKKLKIF